MDTAVFNAHKRREELRAELEEIDRFLRLYDKFKRASTGAQGALELRGVNVEQAEEQSTSKATDAGGEVVSDTPRGWTREQLRPKLREIIYEANRPLTRSGLLKALDERGIPIGGTNRSKNMGTIMWRLSDDFVSLEGFGYWLRDRPYPPAGYDPADQNSPEAIKYTLGGGSPPKTED